MADTAGVDADNPNLVALVEPLLLDQERLLGVYAVKGFGSGWVAVTNKRFVYSDPNVWKGKKTLLSVPFTRVTAVGMTEGRGGSFGSSELVLEVGSKVMDFEFRGADKAQRTYKVIMEALLQ